MDRDCQNRSRMPERSRALAKLAAGSDSQPGCRLSITEICGLRKILSSGPLRTAPGEPPQQAEIDHRRRHQRACQKRDGYQRAYRKRRRDDDASGNRQEHELPPIETRPHAPSRCGSGCGIPPWRAEPRASSLPASRAAETERAAPVIPATAMSPGSPIRSKSQPTHLPARRPRARLLTTENVLPNQSRKAAELGQAPTLSAPAAVSPGVGQEVDHEEGCPARCQAQVGSYGGEGDAQMLKPKSPRPVISVAPTESESHFTGWLAAKGM